MRLGEYDAAAATAAGVARGISRLMRASGFEMSKRLDRRTRTEGFVVRRVGLSASISVYYCIPDYRREDLGRIGEKEAHARAFLVGRGYTLDGAFVDASPPKIVS